MIKKLLRKISALSIAVLSCCVFAIGCGANDKSKPLTADQSHLFGMCELTIDTIVGDRVDSTVNNEWVADKMGELGVDTARVWLHHTNILYRSERSNELYLNETVASHFHDYFQKLKENGVKRILAMSHRFIQPYGYPGDELSVPDPWEEPEYYQQFLDIQERAYQIIATEFPEIDFYEPGNEWDDEEQGLYLHRAGWSLGKGDLVYSAAEAGQIAADVCYYANRGIKSVNPDAKVVSPGTTWCYSGITFLDSMYQSIEEGRHPTGEDVADKNVDNYFQIVAWHPYIDPEYEKVDDEIMIDAWLEETDPNKP